MTKNNFTTFDSDRSKYSALSMPNSKETLPVHSLSGIEFPVQVRRIEHKNPYDFTQEHRHTYFEIFFFETGGGSQLIDFMELPVKENSCYIVFPQQIHLLKRKPNAHGLLVQFREEEINSKQIQILLQQHWFSDNPPIIFEQENQQIEKFKVILLMLQESVKNPTGLSSEINRHLLHALLLQLFSIRETESKAQLSSERQLLFEFQQLLEEQYKHNHQVRSYSIQLNSTEKKLSATTKKFMGLSPLQVIHNRMLLEAKRLLLFESASHKEISFQLGFDSPASFSLFIKNKTGLTPTELNKQLVDIHK